MLMSDTSWRCPYCKQIATITNNNISEKNHNFSCNNKDGDLAVRTAVIVCPNNKCREYTITAYLYKVSYAGTRSETYIKPERLKWELKPESCAQALPDYIPKPIRDDYIEACLICEKSPKASATLSRRCVQGMIRDYWGISKKRLVDEVAALKDKIDLSTWKAIDAVRSVGNIGAHMEQDINVIIDVEANEANLLIGLIESLLEDWYVRRYERDQQMQKVIDLAQTKDAAKVLPESDMSAIALMSEGSPVADVADDCLKYLS